MRAALGTFRGTCLSFAMSFLAVSGAAAEQSGLRLELNAVNPVSEDSCRLSFMVRNTLDSDIDAFSIETVIFNDTMQVDRLTLFDLKSIPANRPRVRQFDLSGVSCGGVGLVLVNGVASCEGAGLSPEVCEANLSLSSRTEIEVDG